MYLHLILCLTAVAAPAGALAQQAEGEPGAVHTLDAARMLRMEGYYDRAVHAFGHLLDDPETRIRAACGLAVCHLETGRYGEAKRVLRNVEAEAAESGTWHRTMTESLSVFGRYAEAITHAERAIALDKQDHRSRFLLGALYETVGDRDKAMATYEFFDRLLVRKVPTEAPGLTAAAQGFLRYSVLVRHPNLSQRTIHCLQELYQPAYERIDRTYWPARLAAADLLRSKFRVEEAVEDYKAAMRVNEHLAAAHVGLGKMALEAWNFEEVERRIELATEGNPKSVPALQLTAGLKLTERRYFDAAAAATAALEINPFDVTSLGFAAAAAYSLNKMEDVERYRSRAYQVSPKPAAFHRVLGDALGGLRQYAESQEQYELAIQADPTDPHARTELGLMYMQWGREAEARESLAAAWELDDFDARTHNTLELLDKLAAFATFETEHFTIRYDAELDGILPETIAETLEELHEEVCEDFAWTLTEKTIIEFFPTHRMFGVRITGKPWIHTVGACTGRVIAMDSPRQHPQLRGPYDIAAVLRHEFTHTVTLAATGNRIPHWFTEGLAVLQEDTPRSFAWCQLLAETVRRNELFTLASIDWGFIRPRRPNDRQLAYAQSEWMCEWIIERFGYDSLHRLIEAYRERKPQDAALIEVLGIGPDAFDDEFRRWARAQAKSWGLDLTEPENVAKLRALALISPNDAFILGRLAQAELDDRNPDRALAAARRGLECDEDNVLCLTLLGKVLWALREQQKSRPDQDEIDTKIAPAMERLTRLDPTGCVAPKALGLIALKRGDFDEAIGHLVRLKRLCPMDPAGDRGLAGAYLGLKDHDGALSHLLELARTENRDADVPATIARIYGRKERLAAARHWYRRSLFIDPFSVKTREALTGVLMRMDDTEAAAREYEALCRLDPKAVRHFEHAAAAYDKLGRPEDASRLARRAVAVDASTNVRHLIAQPNE